MSIEQMRAARKQQLEKLRAARKPPADKKATAPAGDKKVKAAKLEKKWNDPQRFGDEDPILAAGIDNVQDTWGMGMRGRCIPASEAERFLLGVPLPAFCLAYLFGITVLPLGRFVMISGQWGSCKTAFLFEIMRWFGMYGGRSVYIENENKDSDELRRSILRHRKDLISRIAVHTCDALQVWMKAIVHWSLYFWRACTGTTPADVDKLEEFVPGSVATAAQLKAQQGRKKSSKKLKPGEKARAFFQQGPVGWRFPIALGVDSLMGSGEEGTIAKILKEGAPTRTFAISANFINMFMQAMAYIHAAAPITLLATNHLKPKQSAQGVEEPNTPGGKAPKFHATIEIEMHRVGDIDLTDSGGINLVMRCRKSSVGRSRMKIKVPMLWRMTQQPDGTHQQITYFDWYGANIDLLLSFKKRASVWKNIQSVLHLRPTTGRRVSSEPLGLKEPVSYSEAGRALEQRPDLLDRLYPILYIKQSKFFEPGVDYREQLERAVDERNRAADRCYEAFEVESTLDQLSSQVAECRGSRDVSNLPDDLDIDEADDLDDQFEGGDGEDS